MLKPKVYIETTIFNYFFLADPGRKEDILATKNLLEKVKQGEFEAYVSALTIVELERCPDNQKKTRMLELITLFNLEKLSFEDSSSYESLAEKYIIAGAIPKAKKGDALHIAMATTAEMDVLTSWNFEHIVRFKTQEIVRAINLTNGYRDLSINTPREVISS